MYKKINLSVSSCLIAGLFITSQQASANHSTMGGQAYVSAERGSPVLDGFGNPVKSSNGSIVRDNFPKAMDTQYASVIEPTLHHHAPIVPKPHHNVRPTYMAKPVQKHSIGLPPAKPNQCYAKVRTGPTFKNVVKRVQVSPAVNKRVLVRGPQYGYINKRVQVRPASHTYRYIPAQYKNVSKRILVKPAHYAWQKGKRGPITRIDNMTGEILCRVKVPAVYRTVVQKVLVRPGHRVKKTIPAAYQVVKQKKLVSPAQYKNVHQPARFVNKTYRVKTGGVGYKWQPINC